MQLSSRYSYAADSNGNYLEGYASNTGFEIRWKGPNQPNGATHIQIIEALLHHISYMQKTKQASNEMSKVVYELHKALDVLKGTPTLGSTVEELKQEGLGNGPSKDD